MTVSRHPGCAFCDIVADTSKCTLLVEDAEALAWALQPPGLSLVQANGEAANQTVPHLHVHVLPRRPGGQLLINWSRSVPGDPDRIAAIAARIREQL